MGSPPGDHSGGLSFGAWRRRFAARSTLLSLLLCHWIARGGAAVSFRRPSDVLPDTARQHIHGSPAGHRCPASQWMPRGVRCQRSRGPSHLPHAPNGSLRRPPRPVVPIGNQHVELDRRCGRRRSAVKRARTSPSQGMPRRVRKREIRLLGVRRWGVRSGSRGRIAAGNASCGHAERHPVASLPRTERRMPRTRERELRPLVARGRPYVKTSIRDLPGES